jgi:ABC-type multidrug transport system fused ATPase/permease subunit
MDHPVDAANHAALLAKGGVYARMWARQREAEERAQLAAVAE